MQDFERKIEETLQRLQQDKKEKIERLHENQKRLEKLLNDEENNIKKKIEIIKKDDKNVLQAITEKTSKMKIKLKAISTELIHHQNTDQRCQLFVALKKGEGVVEQLKRDARKQCKDNLIHHYKVDCKASKQNITSLQDYDNFFTFQEIHVHEPEVQRRTAGLYTEIRTTLEYLPSLCLFSENCLLVTNINSSQLMIFKDISVSTSYDRLNLYPGPWAVAKVDNNKAVVTFPKFGIIRLITFSMCMTVTNTEDIKVGNWCHGVAYSNNKLIVSYTRPATVKILDMTGKVLKAFDKDQYGKFLFLDPKYLTISADNKVIYVSDIETDRVIGLTFDGKVKAIYKDDQLKHPCQLTVDRSGGVIVCGFLSNNIHKLSPDLTKVKILLDKDINYPVSVAHCQNKNRLYVYGSHGNIKVFNLPMEYM